ncbi:MAG: chorismate mutase [bacterium]
MSDDKTEQAEKILKPLRNQIDRIDSEIIEKLNQRTGIVLEVARTKARYNLEYHDPHREAKVYKRLAELNRGPFPDSGIHSVYREIMSASLSLEKPLKGAYLGPKGT